LQETGRFCGGSDNQDNNDARGNSQN
jgi:hypothetical protein